MKKIVSMLLVGSLIFSVPVIANAQPPDPPIQVRQKHIPRTPESTIQSFTGEIGGLGTYYSDYVEGYDHSNPEMSQISRIIRQDIGNFVLAAKDITIVPDPQNKELATANFSLEFYDVTLGLRFAQKDSVQLKRHTIPDNRIGGKDEYWTILPGNPQSYFKSFNDTSPQGNQPYWPSTPGSTKTQSDISTGDNLLPAKSGFTKRLATLLAYPEQMLPKIHLQQSALQLKQLGLSLFMFTQDFDERIDLTQEDFENKLTPYMINTSFFTAPDDPPGAISYQINPDIVELSLNAIKDYKNTVAFYFGHDQKLDFRYDGLSPVCFTDGHVEIISPEQAKHLQWKP